MNHRPSFPKVPAAALIPLLQSPLKPPTRTRPLRSSNLAPPPPQAPLTPPLTIQHLRREAPNEVLLYTDASRCPLTGISSAGIYSCGVESVSVSQRLPAGLTSVDAETEALLVGVSIGSSIARRTGRGVVTVCADCIQALEAVNRLVCEGRFGGAGPEVQVRDEWVKGQSGVKGNEEAHRLARKR
ncbi:unnamed protein product [Tuber melanosporum]|uniref:(Perigord truffle) hypothetical protein n=1 Tax=Tuber melanosporum (strain Mel28) TaxID=656061 RepID=D5GM91_TUBMM|nr:uncharacterized protein GSTUM_00010579001 [Tuber melanosporum]CAZ85628.1 unnamed protein product [Tuber melanosporum]